MIKKAIEYIVGLSVPTVQEIGGQQYSDKPLHRIKHNPSAKPITLTTLSSLVEYLHEQVDPVKTAKTVIHVQSPVRVCVYSQLDEERERECLVEVNAQLPGIPFDQFIGHESFCIGLQSKFVDGADTDKALLLKFAGTVEAGSVAEYGDDGVSQKATVKTGLASKGDALVPSRVLLRPYRTFVEVEQPPSEFIFRMNQDRSGAVQGALFEADGGVWKHYAMAAIKAYIEIALCERDDILVIA